eukprot:scaffold16759_cov93-Isochrysis_galbana.AAC.1
MLAGARFRQEPTRPNVPSAGGYKQLYPPCTSGAPVPQAASGGRVRGIAAARPCHAAGGTRHGSRGHAPLGYGRLRQPPVVVSPPSPHGPHHQDREPQPLPPLTPLRRRAAVLMRQHEPLSSPVFAAFATAISTCLEMVARAAAMPGEGFALSKSLQASSPISTSPSMPP